MLSQLPISFGRMLMLASGIPLLTCTHVVHSVQTSELEMVETQLSEVVTEMKTTHEMLVTEITQTHYTTLEDLRVELAIKIAQCDDLEAKLAYVLVSAQTCGVPSTHICNTKGDNASR